MRTTLNLDDHLMREVKSHAASQGVSMTSFIEQTLRLALARDRPRSHRPLPISATMGPPRSGVDLTSNAAIRALVDEGLLPDRESSA